MIDINLLRILKNRAEYNRYKDIIDPTITEGATNFLLSLYGLYFEKYPQVNLIKSEEFFTFFGVYATSLDNEQKTLYRSLIQRIDAAPDESVRAVMLTRLSDLKLMNQVLQVHRRFEKGEEIDVLECIDSAKQEAKLVRASFEVADYIDKDISAIIKAEENNEGLQWRLDCMKRHVKALQPGHFCILGARPDAGKTSFIASEVTNFAKQLDAEQNVVIINNEGVGERYLLRIYQAALQKTMPELIELNKKDKLKSEYIKAVGRLDKIRVIDAHSYGKSKIETAIEKNNAGIVIFDMLDNVKAFTAGDSATHARLEAMYQWGRDLCIKQKIPGIATSQVSADGDGMMFPPAHMLKDSKTGKQGACDLILMLGKSDDISQEPFRYVSLPKNKLQRPGSSKDPRAEVTFDAHRCAFIDGG